ncbi:MAG: family glycosyltransferase, 4-amino-4-deoxy-L-arabinose transferase [Schlesneria sp.]|nr:family glycosyltransferase, 4-amino-4-deoxy-L-arabinose transferase [Schlesneria sp.]
MNESNRDRPPLTTSCDKVVGSIAPESNRVSAASRTERIIVWLLLVVQTGLLAYSATCHSPTDLEPPFLVSGVSHWQYGRYELYRVNPPLPRMITSIPILLSSTKLDWSQFRDIQGSRVEFEMGKDLIRSNGVNSMPLFIAGRWAGIPFSLIGAYFAYRWARELYGGSAGLVALTLFVFEPNLLGHGELITPDGATTAFGILAGYTFWRWLKQPTLIRVVLAGGALGLAELSKMSWLVLFALWPILWFTWRWMGSQHSKTQDQCEGTNPDSALLPKSVETAPEHGPQSETDHLDPTLDSRPPVYHLAIVLLIATYLINLVYVFDGFGTPLQEFQFVSKTLTGLDKPGSTGNRFRDSWLGKLPVPLPKQYVLGLDIQKKDFENYYLPSYLRGEVKQHGGWWYYYLYGLLVKVPCGTWGLFALVVLTRFIRRDRPALLRDELVLLTPAIVLLAVVSSQTEFNRHLRYVFPSLGIFLIFLGQVSFVMTRRITILGVFAIALIAESTTSLILVYPHHLAYFNKFAGGSQCGYRHLTGSSLDWGQDLFYLRDHVKATGQIVAELRDSVISNELASVVIPNFRSQSAVGQRITVVSPNGLEKGKPFPPLGAWMLTPTLWIVEHRPNENDNP